MSFVAVGITLMAVGTGVSIAGTLKQGKEADKIGKYNEAVELENAKAARDSSVEKAKITAERGRRLIAEQKGAFAASGIKINTGSPLVIESQTTEDITKDVGFVLEQGRTAEQYHKSQAAIQRAMGKQAKSQSKYSAWSQGIGAAGSIAFMGSSGGLWGGGSGGGGYSGVAGGGNMPEIGSFTA